MATASNTKCQFDFNFIVNFRFLWYFFSYSNGWTEYKLVNTAPKFMPTEEEAEKKSHKKYAIRDISCCYCYHPLNMHQSLYEFQWRSIISWAALCALVRKRVDREWQKFEVEKLNISAQSNLPIKELNRATDIFLPR